MKKLNKTGPSTDPWGHRGQAFRGMGRFSPRATDSQTRLLCPVLRGDTRGTEPLTDAMGPGVWDGSCPTSSVTSLKTAKFPSPSRGRPLAGLRPAGSYLTLALQLLGGSANDVDVRGWEADGAVHGDVLGGSIRSVDPHVELRGDKATHGQDIRAPRAAQQAALVVFF